MSYFVRCSEEKERRRHRERDRQVLCSMVHRKKKDVTEVPHHGCLTKSEGVGNSQEAPLWSLGVHATVRERERRTALQRQARGAVRMPQVRWRTKIRHRAQHTHTAVKYHSEQRRSCTTKVGTWDALRHPLIFCFLSSILVSSIAEKKVSHT